MSELDDPKARMLQASGKGAVGAKKQEVTSSTPSKNSTASYPKTSVGSGKAPRKLNAASTANPVTPGKKPATGAAKTTTTKTIAIAKTPTPVASPTSKSPRPGNGKVASIIPQGGKSPPSMPTASVRKLIHANTPMTRAAASVADAPTAPTKKSAPSKLEVRSGPYGAVERPVRAKSSQNTTTTTVAPKNKVVSQESGDKSQNSGAGSKVTKATGAATGALDTGVRGTTTALNKVITGTIGRVNSVVGVTSAALGQTADKLPPGLSKPVGHVSRGAGKTVTGATTNVNKTLTRTTNNLADTLGDTTTALGKGDLKGTITGATGGVGRTVGGVGTGLGNTVSGLGNDLGRTVGGPVGGLVGGATSGVGDAVGGLTTGLGNSVSKLGKGDVIGSVGSIGDGVYRGVGGLLGGVLGGPGGIQKARRQKHPYGKDESVVGKDSFF